MISPWIALAVFILTGLTDALYALYTKAVTDAKAVMAASTGSAIHLLSAFAVLQYTQDWRYLLFMCAGSWVGTYLQVRRKSGSKP